jgi:hypothetical protein
MPTDKPPIRLHRLRPAATCARAAAWAWLVAAAATLLFSTAFDASLGRSTYLLAGLAGVLLMAFAACRHQLRRLRSKALLTLVPLGLVGGVAAVIGAVTISHPALHLQAPLPTAAAAPTWVIAGIISILASLAALGGLSHLRRCGD